MCGMELSGTPWLPAPAFRRRHGLARSGCWASCRPMCTTSPWPAWSGTCLYHPPHPSCVDSAYRQRWRHQAGGQQQWSSRWPLATAATANWAGSTGAAVPEWSLELPTPNMGSCWQLGGQKGPVLHLRQESDPPHPPGGHTCVHVWPMLIAVLSPAILCPESHQSRIFSSVFTNWLRLSQPNQVYAYPRSELWSQTSHLLPCLFWGADPITTLNEHVPGATELKKNV